MTTVMVLVWVNVLTRLAARHVGVVVDDNVPF